jgi:tripartite-type tricarboxylate transporter receptor subunit TctC
MTIGAYTRVLALALLTSGLSARVDAQSAGDFYKNRQVRLIVGHAVGNDYDIGARLLAKYLQKYIPGQPTIIAQNMTAAQSVVAANYVYAQAPRDGSVIGTFSRNLPNQALMGQSNIEADLRRFNWLGATSLPGRICAASHSAPVKSVADLFKQELIVGSSGAGTSNSILPTVANHVLGTKFRIIEGYRGSQDVILAVERGEVQGVCATTGQFRSAERLFKEGKLRALFRSEEDPLPDFPDAPSIFDHVKAEDQRAFMRFVFASVEFGRPYVLPPDVPKDRVDLMRRALAAAARDPDLIAEAAKIRLDMSYRQPERLERLLHDLHATPPGVIEAVKKLIPNLQ